MTHVRITHARSTSGRWLTAFCLFLACIAVSSQPTWADEKVATAKDDVKATTKSPAKGEKAGTKKAAGATPAISPEREAAALEFAQRNHLELVSLLQGLKKNAPKEYQAALTDLDRSADRLTKLKDKAPERYEFQLSEWKITSRIRLLAAKLAMAEDPAVESELRAALRERLELRLSAQRTERDRLRKRVEKLDQTIGEMSSTTDELIEKQFSELRKTVPVSKASAKNKSLRPVAAGTVDVKGEKE